MIRRSQIGGAAKPFVVAASDPNEVATVVTAAIVLPDGGHPAIRSTVVRAVSRAARTLVTIDSDDGRWVDGTEPGSAAFAGALVRLRPPASASDARIVLLEDWARSQGAVAVKVEGRRRADGPTGGEIEARERVAASGSSLSTFVAAELEAVDASIRKEVREVVDGCLEVGARAAKPSIVPESSVPLWVARVEAANWFRYRAIDLALRPTVYAVLARFEGDEERSNWGGKSTFLATVAYGIAGWHPADSDEGWISSGADEGFVRLTLSDGSIVERTKRRGGSTKVRFEKADGAILVGAEASAAILRHVGLSKEDFFATNFVRQKEHDRLVGARAGETAKVLADWLDLAPIRRARDAAVELVERAEASLAAKSDAKRRNEEDVERLRVAIGADTAEAIAALRAEKLAEADRLKVEVDALSAEAKKAAADVDAAARLEVRRGKLEADVERFGRDAAAGPSSASLAELVAKERALEEAYEAAKDAHASVDAAFRESDRSLARALKLARGEFDGACPVAPIDCPARAQINADRTGNAKAYDAAKAARDDLAEAAKGLAKRRSEADAAATAARDRRRDAQKADLAAAEARSKLEAAKAALAELGPPIAAKAFGGTEKVRELAKGEAELRGRAEDLGRRLADLERWTLDLAGILLANEKLDAEFAEASRKRAVFLAAAKVLGPGGLQLRWARASLGEVEDGANAILAEASSDLRIRVEWGYESETALATSCATCGAAFSGTSKAKNCARCGAARGKRFEEEPRISATKRSGAATDLAGLALQLGAGAWLRDRRGSAWRSAAIDEPFGALDRAHSKALGAHLATLLAGRFGFRQAFVVAHSTAVMDAMPSRLVVVAKADGTSTIAEES